MAGENMKNRDSECREFQELVPLWLNRNLDMSEIERLQAHLRKCPECMRRFTVERRLFAEAQAGRGQLLPAEIDSELLDRYVFESHTLSEQETTAVEDCLAESGVISDIIDKLRTLPEGLDDLVPVKGRQSLNRLDREVLSGRDSVATSDNVIGLRAYRWAAWVAAAVLVLVAIVGTRVWLGDKPAARLEITLPATTRGSQGVSFTTPASPFVLDARMYVGPEAGHQYNLELLPANSDSILLTLSNYEAFDQSGFADFNLPLDTGQYRVRVYDIYQGDTVLVTKPFEVRLAP